MQGEQEEKDYSDNDDLGGAENYHYEDDAQSTTALPTNQIENLESSKRVTPVRPRSESRARRAPNKK